MLDKPQVPTIEDTDPTEDRRGDILAALEASKPIEPAPKPEPKGAKAGKESAPAKPSEPENLEVIEDSATPAGAEPAKVTEAAATAEESVEVAQTDKIEPPSNWSQADKERFKEQPEGAQKFILDRAKSMEADYTRKTMEIAEFKKEYGAVDEMFAPYKAQLRQSGYTPARAIQGWMAAEQALMNPATREQALVNIAKGYQIDLAKLAGVAPQAQQPQARKSMPTPEELATMSEQEQLNALLSPYLSDATTQAVAPYEKKIQELTSRLERFEQFQNSSLDGQRQQTIQSVMNEVNTFANAKDAAGTLLHPYFKDVENDMALMLAGYHQSQLQAPPLEEIYQRAVRANPSTYERLTAQQTTAAEKKRTEEARAKATQARRAGSSVQGAPGTGQPKPNGDAGNLSVREAILAAMEASAP